MWASEKISNKGWTTYEFLRKHQDENSVPTLYSGVCRVFLHLFKYVGTGRKTRDFKKLCYFNCLIKVALQILQPHLLQCIASLLTPLSGQSLWLEYLNSKPSQTDFRTFYENVNMLCYISRQMWSLSHLDFDIVVLVHQCIWLPGALWCSS